MEITESLSFLVDKVRKERPLIHHITNYVTAENCADICLAAGGRPMMASAPEEAAGLTAGARALVLNLGTLDAGRRQAMELSCAKAKELGIPAVLDPVGVMAGPWRLELALKLLRSGGITCVRGNRAECAALVNEKADGKGIDALTESYEGEALSLAKDGAKKFHCVFAVTGPQDCVSDGKRAMVLNGGHPFLQEITGSGCMSSTLIGCYCAVARDKFLAAVLGLVVLGQSGELAANFLEKKDGPGSFKARLIDAVYNITVNWDKVALKTERLN